MTVIEKAVAWAIETAQDNSHGYSQADRWGPDYDCSSFVITAYEQAGVPLREHGASYTGNMRSALIACGFVDVTYEIGLSSGYGVEAGDVLLNYAAHTCIAIGGGRVANCRTDEGHPQSGDQGQEIRLQSYWNYPWNAVLRYKGSENVKPAEPAEPVPSQPQSRILRRGMTGEDVRALQEKLIASGYPVGAAGSDGDFGRNTYNAVIAFQKDHGLSADGEVGPLTLAALDEALEEKPEDPTGEDDVPFPDDPQQDEPSPPGKATLPWLVYGSSGEAVILLQAALNLKGYNAGNPDGKFGPKTLAAVNKFLEDEGLYDLDKGPDGVVDQAAWQHVLNFFG